MCSLKLLQLPSFSKLGQSEPPHHPPGTQFRNPSLTQSSVSLCGLSFPAIEFWLSTPCLHVRYSVLVEILEPVGEASSEISGLTSVLFSVFRCSLPRISASLLRLAPCLLRARRSGARRGSPFSFLVCTLSAPLPRIHFSAPSPDRCELSLHSDRSVSAAVFPFVNLNVL